MGELIVLSDRLADRAAIRLASGRNAFFFDLACPFSYLAAERIERMLGDVDWIPVDSAALREGSPMTPMAALQTHVEGRASALRLPLVWPESFPAASPRALRAAAYAVEIGAGARFALVASRLAFCGGYDLEDPETLEHAAGAAGIPLHGCLEAAADERRDAALAATARGLRQRGLREAPVVRVGERWLSGEPALIAAAALRRETVATQRAAEARLAPLA